jgi:hypothetical protein
MLSSAYATPRRGLPNAYSARERSEVGARVTNPTQGHPGPPWEAPQAE